MIWNFSRQQGLRRWQPKDYKTTLKGWRPRICFLCPSWGFSVLRWTVIIVLVQYDLCYGGGCEWRGGTRRSRVGAPRWSRVLLNVMLQPVTRYCRGNSLRWWYYDNYHCVYVYRADSFSHQQSGAGENRVCLYPVHGQDGIQATHSEFRKLLVSYSLWVYLK